MVLHMRGYCRIAMHMFITGMHVSLELRLYWINISVIKRRIEINKNNVFFPKNLTYNEYRYIISCKLNQSLPTNNKPLNHRKHQIPPAPNPAFIPIKPSLIQRRTKRQIKRASPSGIIPRRRRRRPARGSLRRSVALVRRRSPSAPRRTRIDSGTRPSARRYFH